MNELGLSPVEVAAALDRTLTELEQWLHGELRPEAADVIEVGFSLLAAGHIEPRPCRDSATERIFAAQ